MLFELIRCNDFYLCNYKKIRFTNIALLKIIYNVYYEFDRFML